MFLEVGTHSFWAGVELLVLGSDSVGAGVVLLVSGSARLGIIVFFDDEVHVHICHELAHVREGSAGIAQVRHGFATTKGVTNGHLVAI